MKEKKRDGVARTVGFKCCETECEREGTLEAVEFVALVEQMKQAGYTDELLDKLEHLPVTCGMCAKDEDEDSIHFPPAELMEKAMESVKALVEVMVERQTTASPDGDPAD